ncbi:unnamed protein product [Closterium sp. NIES-53]
MLLLADTPKVLPFARSYFYLRVIGVPPQLLVMCTSGILQGYKVRSMRFSAVMLDAAIGGYSQGAALRAQLLLFAVHWAVLVGAVAGGYSQGAALRALPLLPQSHWRAAAAARHVHLGDSAGVQGAVRLRAVDSPTYVGDGVGWSAASHVCTSGMHQGYRAQFNAVHRDA